MRSLEKLLAILAALLGFFGVMLAAASAHLAPGTSLGSAALILLTQAPAVLAVLAAVRTGLFGRSFGFLGALALVVGSVLFAGGITMRLLTSLSLPAMLAPIGGTLLFDNTLWSKRVINAHDLQHDKDTQNMHAFNEYAKDTPNAQVVLLPIRDGITMITKLN